MPQETSARAPRPKPTTFVRLIDLWPSIADFARDMGLKAPHRARAYQWYKRNYIDLEHWHAVIAATGRRRKIALTLEDLFSMALARRDRPAGRFDRQPSEQQDACEVA